MSVIHDILRFLGLAGDDPEPPADIRVYKLVDPKIVSSNADAIASLLFGLAAPDPDRPFSITEASGSIVYFDYGYMNSSPPTVTVDKNAAVVQAQNLVKNLNTKIKGDAALSASGVPPLLPEENVTLVDVVEMMGADGTQNHWLVRLGASLSSGEGTEMIPVEGGIIEVRIGMGGEVVGLYSRWRPPIDFDTVPRLAYEDPPEMEEDLEGVPALLLFMTADEAYKQPLLAPYYCVILGDDAAIGPASGSSLVVRIWQRRVGETIQLAADVYGGSGEFEFSWAAWRPDALLDDGFQDLGNLPVAEIDSEFYVVMLSVKDTVTNGFVQLERFIFDNAESISPEVA